MQKIKKFVILIILALLLFSTLPVKADIAPPLQPPGSNPSTSEFVETKVQMIKEVVRIIVGDVSELYYLEADYPGVNAKIQATFYMQNQGEETEQLQALFPLTNTAGWGDGWDGYPELRNFSVRVNGNPVHWEIIETDNPNNNKYPPVKWAAFETSYPPDETVVIEVTYDIQSTGYFPAASFYYVLETGHGWYGPIVEGDIILVMPYEASSENILSGDPSMHPFREKTSGQVEFEGNEVHWHFEDLEPTSEDNWVVTIIEPQTWKEILTFRDRLDKDADDIEALYEITKLYNLIIDDGRHWMVRSGAEELIPLSYEAHVRVNELEPHNAELLANYAHFLMILYESDYDLPGLTIELEQIYQLVHEAYATDFTIETASNIKSEIERRLGITPKPPGPFIPPTETPEKDIPSKITVVAKGALDDTENEISGLIPISLVVILIMITVVVIISFIVKKKKSK